ncbi:hypothetical protein GYA25_02770 [Candidatus Woesearchaeota archaeon]|nr:hypothetical protein [Candidatus Woesearchaeota archaeon]
MVNQEILGGLIAALERGESLKKSMMSLYNAGYKKEEIEEAAMMTLGMDITSLKELLNQNNQIQNKPIPLNNPKPPLKELLNQNNQIQNKPIPLNNSNPPLEQQKPQPVLTPIQNIQPQQILPQQAILSTQNILIPPNPPIQNVIIQEKPQIPKIESQEIQMSTKQKVSDYSTNPKKKKGDNLILILLILLLVFLAGVLISLFVFKNQIITFFSRFLTGSSS